MRRFVHAVVAMVMFAGLAWAEDFPQPDFSELNLENAKVSDPERPQWIDATPMFHDMGLAAARRFKPGVSRSPREGVPVGGEEKFWSINISNNQFYQVTAILKKIGKSCYIYVEKGQTLADGTIDGIADEFDNKIYPIDTKTFGSEPNPGIDGDEKITLLLLDIKDGWAPGKGYVGGYFFPLNEYSVRDFPQSNEREMFYLDINPADPTSAEYMGIVAHEFQHMIHFNHDPKEDKWVNEGMSQYAFRACGYSHPSQIMSFAQRPDHTLAAWQNTVDDYGAVYLFFYYTISKYGGCSELPAAIVANPAKSIEGVNAALTECSIKTDFATLFADWSIANILNNTKVNGGKYGYDETLPVQLLSTTVDPRDGNLQFKDSVNSWASDYYQCFTNPFWSPGAPTLSDAVNVPMPDGGMVIWSVDGGVLPPQAIWPPETKEYDPGKSVRTKVTGNSFKVGPFTGSPIKKLNISVYNKKLIPLNHAQITIGQGSANLLPIRGTLTFHIKGTKGKEGLNVRLITEGEQVEVKQVSLDKDWAGECKVAGIGSQVKRAILVVGNTGPKPFEYELSTSYAADPQFADYLAGIERGSSLKVAVQADLTAGNQIVEPLFLSVGHELETLSEKTATALDPTRNTEARANSEELARIGNKQAFTTVFKLVSEKRTFASRHGETWNIDVLETLQKAEQTSAPVQCSVAAPKTDDEDSSHTNITYLCNKKQELIHGLTHLKIDPKFLEGQILQMYKMLQLNLNLPNIPFPDGLGLVDYNEKAAQDYIDRLRNGATQEEKDSLRRLTVFEDLTERIYNDNLTMAEDFGSCLYETFRLVLSGRATLLSIAGGLQDVPVVGPIAKKVVHVIIGKSIGVVVRVTNLMAVKLKSPYNTIVPIVVQVGGSIAAKLLHVQVDSEKSWMLPWAAKTATKYAFVSIPRIGYVAHTQPLVNTGVEQAVKNDFGGTLDAAKKAVLDDGDAGTKTSVYEIFADTISRKHAFTMKEIEVAKIAKAIAQIAAYASIIDPTNIARVAAIVATSVSGGALVHGMVNSVMTFTKADVFLADGLKIAYHPERPLPTDKNVLPRKPAPAGKLGSSLKLAATLEADYQGLMKQINTAMNDKNLKELTQLAGNLVAFEETFEPSDRLWSSSCQVSLAGTRREGELETLLDHGINADMLRAQVLAELLPAAAGVMPSAGLSATADKSAKALDGYIAQISRILGRDAEPDMMPGLVVTQTKVEKKEGGWIVSAVVTSLAPTEVEASFTLYGAPDTTISKAPGTLKIGPWESSQVQWVVSGSDEAAGFPVTIAAEAKDCSSGIGVTVLP